MLSPFTTPDQVRAHLGLNDEELPDAVLNLPIYETGLRMDLRRLSSDADVIALFTSAHAKVEASQALTTDEQNYYSAVQYFSSLAAAAQAGISLALRAPKRLTDDKSGIERFSGTPFADVRSQLEERLISARGAVLSALSALASVSLPATTLGFRYMTAVKRGYDPVTGS